MDLLTLVAKITADTSEYDKKVGQAREVAESVGGKIGSALGTAAKVGVAVAGAATTAVAGIGGAAVSSYAKYEQLVGGVDKLYGDASGKLQEYADKAYATSGMSANHYMETATSFAAALTNSLQGDVNKAADVTDVAMRAISDNVNVFGSDFGSVQNAFQGFAKQNYTMLDNLKLGYGGTKTEMERLIKDANEWGKANGQASDLSIDSFADVITAIDQIQQKQNIANTTTKEAMTTIEGSAGAVRAAWENVITTIGRGEGISEAINGLVSSIFGAKEGEGLLSQMIPRIKTAIEGVGQFISTAGPIIAERLPELINSILPDLLETGMSFVSVISDGIINSLPVILDLGIQLVGSIVRGVTTAMPKLITSAVNLFKAFKDNIIAKMNELVPGSGAIMTSVFATFESWFTQIQTVVQTITDIIKVIWDKWGNNILKAAELIWKKISTVIDTAIKLIQHVLNIVMGLISGDWSKVWEGIKGVASTIWNAIVSLVNNNIEHVRNIVDAVMKFLSGLIPSAMAGIKSAIDTALTAIKAIVTNITNAVKSTVSNILTAIKTTVTNIINAIKTTVSNTVTNIKTAISSALTSIKTTWDTTWTNLKNKVTEIWNSIKSTVETLKSGIATNINSVRDSVKNGIDNAVDYIKDLPSRALRWGSDLIDNFVDGIRSAMDSVGDIVSEVADTVTDFLGFSEPDRGPLSNFHTFAPDMIDLFTQGIKDNAYKIPNAFNDAMSMVDFEPIQATVSGEGAGMNRGGVSVVQNIYSKAKTASELMREARYEQERAVLMGV